MKLDKSRELFARAQNLIPGGVNSPVRAFKSVGSEPVFIDHAEGCRVFDVDGNEYIDYVGSWGPLILGHSHPEVVQAVREAAGRGTSYGAPCLAEVELAELICDAIPSIEKVRMVSSGTEATMSALRLARAFTGRNKVLKFEGCYHGHADSFLIKAGSGLLTGGVVSSPGVPEKLAQDTLVAVYNDITSVEELFKQYGGEIAAVIVEPVAGNMGLVLPDYDFLYYLRKITEHYNSLLIFDEVITGFRTRYGGFQDTVGIKPDLTTLGKIIGGGLPVGAYGGRKEIMDRVAPSGDVYQAGTLSGNPLAMAAGAATINVLRDGEWYDRLEVMTYMLTTRLTTVLDEFGLYPVINRLGSMFCIYFTEGEVGSLAEVMTCDTEQYSRTFRRLLQEGVYFPPSQFEVCFMSCAHDLTDIDQTVEAFGRALEA